MLFRNLYTYAKNILTRGPTVYSTSIVANLKSRARNRFNDVKILGAIGLAQYDVAQRGRSIAQRHKGNALTALDLSAYAIAGRFKLNRLAAHQFLDVLARPADRSS